MRIIKFNEMYNQSSNIKEIISDYFIDVVQLNAEYSIDEEIINDNNYFINEDEKLDLTTNYYKCWRVVVITNISNSGGDVVKSQKFMTEIESICNYLKRELKTITTEIKGSYALSSNSNIELIVIIKSTDKLSTDYIINYNNELENSIYGKINKLIKSIKIEDGFHLEYDSAQILDYNDGDHSITHIDIWLIETNVFDIVESVGLYDIKKDNLEIDYPLMKKLFSERI